MPKLLIQPLVENAIKYGIDEQGGEIWIGVFAGRGSPDLEVETTEKECPRKPAGTRCETMQG